MTPAQCRAARALLNWNAEALGAVAQVSASTIRNFEAERGKPPKPLLYEAIRRALEAEGIEFIDRQGRQGAGVLLNEPASSRSK